MDHWHAYIKHLLDIRVLLGLIALAAAIAFTANVVSDRSASGEGTAFERIDAYVRDQMDDSRLPGVAIAIVEGDQVAHTRGFGDDGDGNAITPETPFWIGSNTKSFTALAIMQLAEAGLIDVDAPVLRYLPSFAIVDAEAASQITVRHLLNQTSGFSRADGLEPVLEEKEQSLEEAVADLRMVDLNRPVGESFEYSNLNFVVLGLIVETVSGQPWAEYIEDNAFEPLGMDNSYTSLEEAQSNGLTKMYSYAFGVRFEHDPNYLPGVAPTGYIYSTAQDMAQYLSAYLNDGTYGGSQVLTPAGVDQMLQPNTNVSSRQLMSHDFTSQYAQGWFVGEFGAADDARWHLGNLYQFAAWMVLLPETDQAVVVLFNSGSQVEFFGATGVYSRIPIGIVNILRGEEPPSGIGLTRFYILFDAVVVAILAVQVWSLVRVARRRPSLTGGLPLALGVAPLFWEVLLSLFVISTPQALLGMSWPATFRAMPDVALMLVTVSALWLLTGTVRIGRLVQATASARRTADAGRQTRATQEGYR